MPTWPDDPSALPPGSPLCDIDEIAEDSPTEVRVHDSPSAPSLLLFRLGGHVRCYVNLCPHFMLPLNAQPKSFLMMSDNRIMCAHHCAVFQIEDGFCIDGPAKGACLEAVPVTISGSTVVIGDRADETS